MSHLNGGGPGVNQNDNLCSLIHATPPSHDILAPAAMADHPRPCPYQEKVTANPTTARVLLEFLRDFVELRARYTQWTQSCPCPMMRCEVVFAEPLQLIDHLLSCPELSRGEFKCWKCSSPHAFPTTDGKSWPSEWPAGWKGQGADVHEPLQRKRSLSDKVSKVFVGHRRRRSSVDRTAGAHQCAKHSANPSFEWNFADPQMRRQLDAAGNFDPRLNHLACVFGNLQNTVQGQMGQVDSSLWECPSTPTTDSSKNQGFWAEMDEEMGDISSTASIYEPTNVTNSSGASRSSLPYNAGLAPNQYGHPMVAHEGGIIPAQQYMPVLSPQPGSEAAPTPSPFQTQSPQSPLSRDEMFSGMLSPVGLEQQGDCEGTPQWWGARTDLLGLPGAQGTGFVPTTMSPAEMAAAAASPVHMPLQGVVPRPVTADMSMPNANAFDPYTCATHTPGLYGVAAPEGNHPIQVFSPPPQSTPSSADHQMEEDGGPEELVCDECNWKPRGVRENLKGYLRKHKNTHKNLRFPCDVPGCNKDFGRQDNLKAHKRDKHHIDLDTSSTASMSISIAPSISSVPAPAPIQAPMQAPPAAAPLTVAGVPVTQGAQQPRPVLRDDPNGEERPGSEHSSYRRGPLPEHTVLWGLNY